MDKWLIILCISCSVVCNAQLVVNFPSISDEATSIWRTINDIEFLEQQGYNINLPQSLFIDTLVQKSKNGQFGNADYGNIYQFLEREYYEKSDYESAYKKVIDQKSFIEDLLEKLKSAQADWDWNFKFFDSYPVVFTLFGTGGSYDPNTGKITLWADNEGRFKNYENPTNTIIHEIIHMGIEESIVQKHTLSHGNKERIVDRMVYVLFSNLLPNYRVQTMGDERLDALIASLDDIKQLDTNIAQFMQ